MTTALELALEAMPLATGQTYRCHVRGHLVEVRVLPPEKGSMLAADDVRLDAWVELPPPKSQASRKARPATWPLPDVPWIPVEMEGET